MAGLLRAEVVPWCCAIDFAVRTIRSDFETVWQKGRVGVSEAITLGLFTLGGVAVTSLFSWLNARREDRRSLKQLQIQDSRDRRIRLADLLRDAVIGVAQAWAEVSRLESQRGSGSGAEHHEADIQARARAFADLGLNLNQVLILPTGEPLRQRVMAVEAAAYQFRRAADDEELRRAARRDVREQIFELFATARDQGTV